jgi:hypothetical protein
MPEYQRRLGDMTPSNAPEAYRRAYLYANAFEFWLGFAAVVSGITYAINPAALHNSAVGEQSGVLAYVWAIMYFLGGLGIVTGFWNAVNERGWRLELAGLWILAGGLISNGCSVILEHGIVGISSTTTFYALAAACLMRGRAVVALTGASRRP